MIINAIIPILCCIGNYTIVRLFVLGIKNKGESNSYSYQVKIVAIVGSILLWLIEYNALIKLVRQMNISTYSPLIFLVLEKSSLIFSMSLFTILLYSLLFKSNSWRDCIRKYKPIVFISYIGWSISFLALLILHLYF